jgi:iron complex transport system substrate-binding protein
MIRFALATLAALSLALPALAQSRSIPDSAGRVVELPEQVGSVFAAGPPAAILLCIMTPDRMLGWPRANRADDANSWPNPMPICPNWAH